jgi:hypothetical protein
MGTSTSQRSPRTPEWERVHRLYDDPAAPPEAIVNRIVHALTPTTRAELAGSAVARCLGTLTSASAGRLEEAALSLDPSLPAAADLAAALRAAAERDIARARVASRFGEIGLDALSAAGLEVGGQAEDAPQAARAALARYAEERRLSELAKTFLAHDLAYAFRYFVERDTPAHVGGRRLQTVTEATRLADDIVRLCHGRASGLQLGGIEDELRRAVGEGGAPGHPLYESALGEAMREGLGVLGGLT